MLTRIFKVFNNLFYQIYRKFVDDSSNFHTITVDYCFTDIFGKCVVSIFNFLFIFKRKINQNMLSFV